MAADIVQECFISIAKTFYRIDPKKNFSTYFYKIVLNKTIDYTRKIHNKIDAVDMLSLSNLEEKTPSPLEIAQARNLEKVIYDFINNLPKEKADTMEMSIKGFAIPKIAEFLKAKQSITNYRLSYSRKKIKEYLNKLHSF